MKDSEGFENDLTMGRAAGQTQLGFVPGGLERGTRDSFMAHCDAFLKGRLGAPVETGPPPRRLRFVKYVPRVVEGEEPGAKSGEEEVAAGGEG